MKRKPFFISFEGGEGAGKTTQINMLANTLTGEGHKVVTTREPGGTPEGEKIRNLLVQRKGGSWTPMSEVLMLYAARSMLAENIILPALASEKIVITDRFYDSTLAYQGYGRGFSIETIESIRKTVLGDLKPDLTCILNVDPETGLKRSKARLSEEHHQDKDTAEDRFERLDLDFHKKVYEGFQDIAAKNKDRCVLLDANLSIEEMAEKIAEHARKAIEKK